MLTREDLRDLAFGAALILAIPGSAALILFLLHACGVHSPVLPELP